MGPGDQSAGVRDQLAGTSSRGPRWGGGGRPLGSRRQLPPQLIVGRRPLGGAGGIGEGVQGGAIWGVGGGEGGRRLPLPPLALPLTIPSP